MIPKGATHPVPNKGSANAAAHFAHGVGDFLRICFNIDHSAQIVAAFLTATPNLTKNLISGLSRTIGRPEVHAPTLALTTIRVANDAEHGTV